MLGFQVIEQIIGTAFVDWEVMVCAYMPAYISGLANLDTPST